MGSFFLIDEHLDTVGGTDSPVQYVSVSPYWIIMVIPYMEAISSSKQRLAKMTRFNTGEISLDTDDLNIAETKDPIIITSSCIQMDISSSKNTYTQNLNAVLKPGKVEFLSAISPGDWCFCWMMNTKEKQLEVLSHIKKKETANAFDDGLKFCGRVHDIRKILVQNPTGIRTTQYNISGVGFGELDSSTFFDPLFATNNVSLNRTLADMGIVMTDIYRKSAEAANGAGGISVNKILPALITAFLGKGIAGPGVKAGGIKKATGAAVATEEMPYAYVIPSEVANILGAKTPSKGVFCYADILEVIQGLQKYTEDVFWPDGTGGVGAPAGDPILNNLPENQNSKGWGQAKNMKWGKETSSEATRHFTTYPLKGIFLPVPTSFSGVSIWNLLNQWVNPAINEMYTAMKYTPSGRVMPTLVVRQLPFSSPILNQHLGNEVTAFHELPRWVADDVLVRSLDVGKSDGARTNFVHIYAQPGRQTTGSPQANQYYLWPPISDAKDTKRHGLRPHIGTIQAAAIDGETGGPGQWMQIKSDFLFGQHMMLTGSCSLLGVTFPIVPGDNFEFDGILFHIEAVNHHVEITADGHKTFTTQLQLTHGMRSDFKAMEAKLYPQKKHVKGRPHLRDSVVNAGVSVETNKSFKDNDKASRMRTLGSKQDLHKAIDERQSGSTSLEVGEKGENLDIYLYAGIDPNDNRELQPGLTIVDEED